MIKINKIGHYKVPIFHNDEKIGECENVLEFEDVCLQIAKNHEKGYSFQFNNKTYPFCYVNGEHQCEDAEFWTNMYVKLLVDIINTYEQE